MYTKREINTFFELVRAGLWGREVQLSQYKDIDYAAIMRLAEEQAVVGLVTAGLEHVIDVKVPQEWILQFVGSTLQIEQQNRDMNEFLACLIEQLRKEDVYAILVKGQGIAQCYDKPLWRATGDIDLLLSDENYERAKKVLLPLAQKVEREFVQFKHLGMTMSGNVVVELHGTLHCRLSHHVDKTIDEVQKDVFYNGNVRLWKNGNTTVSLPSPDNDIVFVFTHILKHFYQGGIGLRQICDWCRLLWIYREIIDKKLLERRLKNAGLMSEWRAFAAYAVDILGMPSESMPLYSLDRKWPRKAQAINSFVLEVGNFGSKRDNSYGTKYPFLVSKVISLWRRTTDSFMHFFIFPLDSIKAWWTVLVTGIRQV